MTAGSEKVCSGALLNVIFDKNTLALGVVGCVNKVSRSSEVATPSCTARIKTGLKRRTSKVVKRPVLDKARRSATSI
jgi:hypothetical protein